jgi:hypothetical protein
MSDSFFSYLQRLESMAFFSGFPLIYALAFAFAGSREKRKGIQERLVISLPFAYALLGVLYLGLQLKNLYPDYSIENIRLSIQNPWLTAWGLLSILFWIPALAKKPVLALLHSFVFFYFLLSDLFSHELGKTDKSILKNDMNIYTTSILLNITCLLVVFGFSYLLRKKKPIS